MNRKENLRARLELSVIYLCAALLMISLIHLAGNWTAQAQALSPADDLYPDLYAPGFAEVSLNTGRNIVYLTFDDGPSPITEQLLEILRKYNAKATFFVTAQVEDEDYLATMYERIVEEGHALGLHTYTHKFKEIYASPDAYLCDIDRLRALIEKSCGYRPSIMRFPGGSSTSNASRQTINTLIDELAKRGYLWYDWDIPTADDQASLRRPEDIARTIIKGVESSDTASIVLCHDNNTRKTTPDGIEIALAYLTEKGYEFHALPSYHYAVFND